ncbi:acyl carrier protein [Aliikangiella coralliicola]|uniref:Acyl carrier protein n=1 Tax=Aliikangiella coralliicola TaxID=2592383 RepID=A0A545UEF6_9GAMM|nr:acyl carrier protein [Aliikangiella coralliicola]TQV87864.1 acyl carrier protein [Aliikangiella coralliicola]
MKDKKEILEQLTSILVEEFEIEKEEITLEANLYQELDLDSIDTVDLVIKLQEITGKKIQPETFKSVRTVNDVVDAVDQLINS